MIGLFLFQSAKYQWNVQRCYYLCHCPSCMARRHEWLDLWLWFGWSRQ